MPNVTFIAVDGASRTVDFDVGTSAMEAAVQNLVRGIDGDCGGASVCGTCHVHVHHEWADRVGEPATSTEREILSLSVHECATSRLSCQIKLREELDGLVLRIPEAQE